MELTTQQKQFIVDYINGTGINHYDYDREEVSHKQELSNLGGEYDDLYKLCNDFAMDYLFCKDADKFKKKHTLV